MPAPGTCKVKKYEEREIAGCLASGMTEQETALVVGRAQSTVSMVANRPHVKALIEEQTQKMLASLPTMVDSTIQDIQTANHLSKVIRGEEENNTILKSPNDILKFKESTYKREADFLRAAGMLPSNNQSFIFNQIYNDNRKGVIAPQVLKALAGYVDREEIDEAEQLGNEGGY